MDNIGFECFEDRPVPVPTRNKKTPQERFEALKPDKKKFLLDSFAEGVDANKLTHKGINRHAIRFYYEKMKFIRGFAKALMLGEVVMEAEERDEKEKIIKEAVLNTPPNTFNQLRIFVDGHEGIELSLQEVEDILNKMIEYSKPDKNGDWGYYRSEINK